MRTNSSGHITVRNPRIAVVDLPSLHKFEAKAASSNSFNSKCPHKLSGMATFINYSWGQEHYVTHFQKTLERLVGANPYVAERIGSAGTKVHTKLKSMLDSSQCMVSILTDDSFRDSTWQNQEIGYFEKLGRPIIPIKEEGLTIKGWLEGTEYITLKPYDLDYNSYELIARIREMLRLTRYHVECQNCHSTFDANMPDHNEINKAIERNEAFAYDCFRCHARIEVNPKSLVSGTIPNYSFMGNYR
jgi:hypothetical protein